MHMGFPEMRFRLPVTTGLLCAIVGLRFFAAPSLGQGTTPSNAAEAMPSHGPWSSGGFGLVVKGVDPRFAAYKPYLQRFQSTVSKQCLALSQHGFFTGGNIDMLCVLKSDGSINRVRPLGTDFSSALAGLCTQAILRQKPYEAWSADMIEAIGHEQPVVLRFSFVAGDLEHPARMTHGVPMAPMLGSLNF